MSQTKVKSGLLNFPDQTDFVKLPSGTTAQRPSSPEKGYSRYNTTDNKLEFWNGTIWQQLPGVVAPTIESVSYPGDDLAADPDGGQTITLTGTNFLDGATVEIEGTTSSVVTVVSKTEITFTAPAKTAGDYNILLTNGDNTTATFIDGITYNGLPSWTTPAGNLGTFAAGSTIPTITLVATEPDGGVVSYSITTGALPTGLALTGADIDGTVPSPAGQTTYNFSVTASDDENQESTERAFNIVVYLQVTNTVDDHDPFGGGGVALYQLNGNALDSSTNAYNGTWSGTEAYGTGVFGQAASLNGSSFINTPNNISTNLQFTVSMWVNGVDMNRNSSDPTLIQTIFYNRNPYVVISQYNGNWQYTIKNSSSQNTTINYATSNFNDNQWYNFVISCEGLGGQMSFYIDGQSVGTNTAPTSTVNVASTGAIGAGFGSQYFSGKMDQVRFFNTALTPLEVESLYRERTVVCGGQADTSDILGDNSCIATYQLNGNANDLSGNYSGTPTDVSYGVGEFDLAGVFNGSSSRILSNVGMGVDHSVSMWIKFNSIPSAQKEFLDWFDSSTGRGVRLNTYNSNQIRFSSGSEFYYNGVTTGVWYHLVYSGDGKCFVNNSLVATLTDLTSTNNNGLYIGSNIDITRFSDCQIDQVRLFNKALNQAEVTTLYNETSCDALACSGTTNTLDILSDGSCIAAYPLDGSPADLSGNYNGVQTNVTYPVGEFDLAAQFVNVTGTHIQTSLPNNDIEGISFWVYFESGVTVGRPFGSTVSSGSGNLSIELLPDGNINAQIQNLYEYATAGALGSTGWKHIVYGTDRKLYINGSLISTSSLTQSFPSSNMLIGASRLNYGSFHGLIDQVRIFNKALSAGEVTTLYNETACN
jgi:hypothetical protein